MLRFLPLLIPVILMACTGPTPFFRGVPASRVEVGGSVFDVRVRGNLAEAVRVRSQYAPRLGPIKARAGHAMAQVSGCEVIEVLGDAAVTTGVLGCDREAGEELLRIARSTPNYDCLEFDYWSDYEYTELECYPY